MFDCPEKETTVLNFKFVSKLTKFSSCQVCKKHLYDLSAISTKCPQCGTFQRMAEWSHEAFIKLCILHKDNHLWLTPFRTEILKLLKPNSLTPHNTKEGIEDAIMNLQDITIKYNIPKILSLTFCWPKAMKKQTAKHVHGWYIQSTTHHINWELYLQQVYHHRSNNDTFWFTYPVAK